MSISQPEYLRRYAAIRELMKKEGFDSLLVVGISDDFNRGNIRYITGSGRGGCCIFPLEGAPVFLSAPNMSASPKLPLTMAAYQLLDLRETTDNARQAVKELSGFDRGHKIGLIGMACISVALYQAVKEKFADRIVDATAIMDQLRAVKSAEEIGKMRAAALVADEVYRRLRNMIKPGLSENIIYGEVKKTAYEMGCEYSFDLLDAGGAPMNMSFYPTGDKLKDKGALFMEISPAFEGYYAQLPVTLPVGQYSPQVRQMVSAWNQADRKVREILFPGTKVSDIYQVLIGTIREKGFISPLRPGHSVGLDILDFWSITESNSLILKSGMLLAIHPCVMLKPFGEGVGMGYTYLITDKGAEKLSQIDLSAELIGE